MYAITNVNVFDGVEIHHNQIIIIENDTITKVISNDKTMDMQLPNVQIDGKGYLATAGFIDLQLNGCGGVLLNTEPSLKTLDIMNKTNLKTGTTQFLPTFITSDQQAMENIVSIVGELDQPELMACSVSILKDHSLVLKRKALIAKSLFVNWIYQQHASLLKMQIRFEF